MPPIIVPGSGRRPAARRVRAAALCAALGVLAAVPAAPAAPVSAQERPPAGKTVTIEEEADQIRRLVAGGFWKPAKLAISKFFEAHEGDRRVLDHLAALEADIRRVDARLALPALKPIELLGRGAVKYDGNSGKAEFVVRQFTEADGWRRAGSTAFFDALFVDEMEVEVSSDFALYATILLGFDAEKTGCYAFLCENGEYGRQPAAFRLDGDGKEPTKLGTCSILFPGDPARATYGFTSGSVTIDIDRGKRWSPADRHDSARFPDKTYRRGFVAVRGLGSKNDPITIRGKLDLTFAKRQIAEADTAREQEWIAANWKRDERLPKWVLELGRTSSEWAFLVPTDCPASARADLARLMRVCFTGEPRKTAPAAVAGLTGAPGRWAEALLAFADRRFAESEAAARDVMSACPAFAPACALAARAAIRHGDDDGAVALAGEALKLAPSFGPAHDVLILVAFRDGDLARMKDLLAAASAAGASTALTEDLRKAHLRAVRGPDWNTRFESITPNFNVTGDASYAVCAEVSKILEESLSIYGEKFRRRARKSRGRVRVFSGFESYAAYVSAIGASPSGTLGVYLPSMRELCIYLHEDRTELQNTIRHEAFHMFLHEFLDDAPIWFNEGYAEFFGFSRRISGKTTVGRVAADQAGLARALLPEFRPVAELMRMEPQAFMADAGVHYVESWALVQFLRETKDPALAGRLGRYFDALLAGRSAAQAYDEVMAPVAAAIDSALKQYVGSLSSR